MDSDFDSIKIKILHSGIFRLDDKYKRFPIGIVNLTANGKKLSTKKYTSYDRISLNKLVIELVNAVRFYLKGPLDTDSLNTVLANFENEFKSFVENWGFKMDDLEPHFKKLANKARKTLKKNLSGPYHKMTRTQKPAVQRYLLVEQIKQAFEQYTPGLRRTDIFYYIGHLLVNCEIEKDDYSKVANRIRREYYRAEKEKPVYDSDPV